MKAPVKRYIYRITHIENIPHILQYGITHVHSAKKNPYYKEIGDKTLIDYRTEIMINSGKALGDHIPFYFGTRMPMLYVIQKGYNGVEKVEASNIVYCVSSIERITEENLSFIFTDGHARSELSKYFEMTEVKNIEEIIDLEAIRSQYWIKDGDTDLKRRKEAEFLIEGDIPLKCLEGFIVYDEKAKEKLIKNGIKDDMIKVSKNDYF